MKNDEFDFVLKNGIHHSKKIISNSSSYEIYNYLTGKYRNSYKQLTFELGSLYIEGIFFSCIGLLRPLKKPLTFLEKREIVNTLSEDGCFNSIPVNLLIDYISEEVDRHLIGNDDECKDK